MNEQTEHTDPLDTPFIALPPIMAFTPRLDKFPNPSLPLHINIQDLLSARTVESDRIEFKEGWNPDAIFRSICAFANDFDNIGGGYILIGVAEKDGIAQRPVVGLLPSKIATIQQEMIGFCNLIRPYYAPHLSIEQVDGKDILVLWVPAGNERPYEVPEKITATQKTWKYYIRRFASTLEAKGADREELIGLANQIPFDDRANTHATLAQISMVLVEDHLKTIKSKLADEVGKLTNIEILEQMELLSGPPEQLFPRNIALMMFTKNPEKYFPCSWVEVVHFPIGPEDPTFKEFPKITGPVPVQIEQTLQLLRNNFLKEQVTKVPGQSESVRIWNYPYPALEEVVANALYHRDYQLREPVEIRVYPKSIVVLNYGGPSRSIKMDAFNNGKIRSRRYRNRRLGDFLKELKLTEGKATGIPLIFKALKDNGSPAPYFDTDEDRSFFEVELFANLAFSEKSQERPMATLKDIDNLLNELLQQAGLENSIIADMGYTADNQIDKIVESSYGTSYGTKASTIAGTIAVKQLKALEICLNAVSRGQLFTNLNISNQRKNYDEYIKPSLDLYWLAMTHPQKLSSPKQKYITTTKGRVLLALLKKMDGKRT